MLLFLYWGLPPRNQSRKPRASLPAGRSLGISQPVVSGGSFTLLGSWKAMGGDYGATGDPSCDYVTKEIENIRKSLKFHRVPQFFWNPQFCQVLDHYDQIIPNDMKRLSNHPFKISLPFFLRESSNCQGWNMKHIEPGCNWDGLEAWRDLIYTRVWRHALSRCGLDCGKIWQSNSHGAWANDGHV